MGGATRFLFLLTPFPNLRHRCPSSVLRLSCRQLHHHHYHYHRHRRLQSPLPPGPITSRLHPVKSSSSGQLHTQSHSPLPPRVSHPWPEFHALLDNLSAPPHFNRLHTDDAYVADADLPDDFLRTASSCLAFARDRPNLLRMVSRRDVEVVVENGITFLFRNGDVSLRRMESFLKNEVFDFDEAHTVDLMKLLLSYVSDFTASLRTNNVYNRELVELSVRNLLGELAALSTGSQESSFSSVQNQYPDRYGQQMLRTSGQNIEMKRGDWNCPRCSFMNFARNVKCLKCDEARPKRQLTGGEWDCPQCDFFNYSRNTQCLRCDCKRPGEFSYATAGSRLGSGYGYGGSANTDDIDTRLVADEEKEQRWFNKVSQLDNTSDLSNIADEDFPEIMPLRKGVNRFVVSTRKTPLERRLANAEYRRNLGNGGMPEGDDVQMGGVDKTSGKKISRIIDEHFSRSSTSSESSNDSVSRDQNSRADRSSPLSSASSSQYGNPKGNSSSYVPFVPLPADMFAKRTESAKVDEKTRAVSKNDLSNSSDEETGAVSRGSEFHNSVENLQLSQKPVNQIETRAKENEQADEPERWFKRVAELENIDATSAISDDEFSEIMPMRKGENRFVVNQKKDRSLTSPMYKRRVALDQTNSTNFVPFVPFPPDYFAKKDRQEPEVDSTAKAAEEISKSSMSEKLDDSKGAVLGMGGAQQLGSGSWNSKPAGENVEGIKTGTSAYETSTNENSTQKNFNSLPTNNNNQSSGYSGKEMKNSAGSSYQPIENQRSGYSTKETTSFAGRSPQPAEDQNFRSSWSGKSLEGSAVKEPDPLDMSEEAKAERWFRRVAQIKDISELSQIPDEDFPSIMPMRKGVNRFVVSKRKTPLERRLTSQQYRKNLPIVSSDPVKKETDSS